jgi:alpha-tubulin suppressor-like RCC1 family protein
MKTNHTPRTSTFIVRASLLNLVLVRAGRRCSQSPDIWLIILFSLLVLMTSQAAPNVVAWGRNNYEQTNVPADLTNAVRVAAGDAHSLALRADGTVVAWGLAYEPGGLSNSMAVAAGYGHNLALREDGTVIAWGRDDEGQTHVPPGLTNVVAVAAGRFHSLALRIDGTVVAWGHNSHGQTNVPAGLTNVVSVAGGSYHSLALRSDGTVVGWGAYNEGSSIVPVTVPPSLTNAVAVAAGYSHSLALRDDGRVVAWGNNLSRQTNVPSGLSTVVEVAAGCDHSLAVRADGSVVAWGNNSQGQSTVPTGLEDVEAIAGGASHTLAVVGIGAPFLVGGLANRQAVAGGTAYFRAVASGARPLRYQWQLNGTNLPGATNALLVLRNVLPEQAGAYAVMVSNAHGSVKSTPAVLSLVPLLIKSQPQNQVTFIGATVTFKVEAYSGAPLSYQWRFNGTDLPGATNYTLVVSNLRWGQAGIYSVKVSNSLGEVTTTDASLGVVNVAAWGDNSWGQTEVPAGLTNVVAVAGERIGYGLALRAEGTVVGWGIDHFGWTDVPRGLTNVVAVAGGGFHNLALMADGTVVAWGVYAYTSDFNYVPAFVPEGLSNVIAVAAGDFHSLALRADGTVVAWGRNDEGQANVPASLTNVVAVAASVYCSLALRADGTIVAWGNDPWHVGQPEVPSGLTNVVAVAMGSQRRLALRADGSLVAWGCCDPIDNEVPAGLTNVVAVAAGEGHHLALRADGTVAAWGRNREGQTSVPVGLTNAVAVAASARHSLAVIGNVAPFVSTPILNQTVLAGGRTYWHVGTQPGARPLTYQWQCNGTNLSGSTNHTLVLADVQPAQAGDYAVTVSNSFGVFTSSTARLTVIPLLITAQPESQVGVLGTPVILMVSAQATTPLSYQWHFNGLSLPGATNSVLVLPNAQPAHAGIYSVTVSSSLGAVTSSSARLDLVPALIKVQPENQAGLLWGMVTFSVDVQGNSPSYQWLFNGTNLPGATNSSLILADLRLEQAGAYSVVISNVWGMVTSHEAELRVNVVVAWGSSYSGETDVPAGLSNVVAVAAGRSSFHKWGASSHCLALRTDGTVVAWGNNDNGQCDIPSDLTNVVAIAAGANHSLLLKGGGQILAWGANWAGQVDVPTSLINAVAVAAGADHSLALRADGTVVAWGNNDNGQCDIPSDLTNVVAVAAGHSHSLALRADGTLVAWGRNDEGQANVPSGLKNVVAVASGADTSLALIGQGPSITAQPKNQIAVAGGSVSFSVVATGTGALTYQWRFNETNTIPGATNSVLVVSNAHTTDAGSYSVLVGNRYGFSISSSATLIVNQSPVADASTSRLFYVSPNGIGASVILDGSRSSDPDGDLLDYRWFSMNDPSIPMATGRVAVVVLAVGIHALDLVVSDGLAQSTASVTVQVVTTAEATQRLIGLVRDSPLESWRKFGLTLHLHLAVWSVERERPFGALLQLKVFQRKVHCLVEPKNPDLAEQWIAEAQGIIDAIKAGCPGGSALERLLDLVRASNLPPQLKSFLIARLEAAQATVEAGDTAGAAGQLASLLADSGIGSASDDLQAAIADEVSAVRESLMAGNRGRLRVLASDRPGCVRVEFQGEVGQRYVIQASTNLVDWEMIGVGTLPANGVCDFEDCNTAKFASRFYRVGVN